MDRKSSRVVNHAIMKVVENQLRDGIPPVTKQTLHRLLGEGIEEPEAKRLIACVVATEIFDVLKLKQRYNRERFVKALHRLPRLPWE